MLEDENEGVKEGKVLVVTPVTLKAGLVGKIEVVWKEEGKEGIKESVVLRISPGAHVGPLQGCSVGITVGACDLEPAKVFLLALL